MKTAKILHRPVFCLLPILQWCYTIFFFKYILKIGLAGEAKKTADFSQAFFTVGQKAFCFLQLAPHYVGTHLDSKFTLEMLHHIGTAPVYMGCGVLYGNRFVGMFPDVGHTFVNIRGNSLRNMSLA